MSHGFFYERERVNRISWLGHRKCSRCPLLECYWPLSQFSKTMKLEWNVSIRLCVLHDGSQGPPGTRRVRQVSLRPHQPTGLEDNKDTQTGRITTRYLESSRTGSPLRMLGRPRWRCQSDIPYWHRRDPTNYSPMDRLRSETQPLENQEHYNQITGKNSRGSSDIASRTLEIGTVKWSKEHIPRKGNNLNDITEEGISLLDDMELWWDKQDLLWSCHTTRTKDRVNIDGSFRLHQNGTISGTFTSDWYLRKGESRDKLGEWLKKTTVRSQDQRRMLQVNTHSFPWNYWRHKITNGKETNRYDLFRVLWIAEGRFNTEDDLPIQTLGHIQHQCETLSEIHTLTHHRYWRIIHTELGRLTSSKWWFIFINGEKTFAPSGKN